MKNVNALTAGFAGAVALSTTHQVLHNLLEDAPRMDLMGEEALRKISNRTGFNVPADSSYGITMAGDLAGNTLFYALAAAGSRKNAVARGTLLGLLAGIGGVYLPKYLGLTNSYSDRTVTTKLLTVAIYTLGGFISGKMAAENKNSL